MSESSEIVRRRVVRRVVVNRPTRRERIDGGGYSLTGLLNAVRDPYSDPIPYLLRALREGKVGVRLQAARFLEELPTPRALPGLIACLDSENSALRYQAIDSLVTLGNRSIIDALLPLVEDPDEQVRANLAWALGQLSVHSPYVIMTLCQLLSDDFWGARRFAAEALFQMPDPVALPFLQQALPDTPAVRVWLYLALRRQGEAFPFGEVLQILRRGSDIARQYAAMTLVIAAGDPEYRAVVPRLVRAFERLLATDGLSDGMRKQLETGRMQLIDLLSEDETD